MSISKIKLVSETQNHFSGLQNASSFLHNHPIQFKRAALEGVDNSYCGRMMSLTVLAPNIVEVMLDDTLPEDLTRFDTPVDPAIVWEEQRPLLKAQRSTR